MIEFKCPTCGKSLKVPDEHAGKKGKCACGAVVAVPSVTGKGPTEGTPTTEVHSEDSRGHTEAREKLPPAVKVVLVGAGLLIAGLLVYFWLVRDTWELNNMLHLEELAKDAIVLRKKGDLQEAINKNQELLDLVGERKVQDERLVLLIENARKDMANDRIQLAKIEQEALARREAMELAKLQEEAARKEAEEQGTLAGQDRPAERGTAEKDRSTASDPEEMPKFAIWVGLGAAAILFLGVVSWVFGTRCPRCKRFFAKQVVGSAVLDERYETRTKLVRNQVCNNMGKVTGTVEQHVPYSVRIRNVARHCKCRSCGHEWIETREEQQKM